VSGESQENVRTTVRGVGMFAGVRTITTQRRRRHPARSSEGGESVDRPDIALHRTPRLRFLLPVVLIGCGLALMTGWYALHNWGLGYDAHAYWVAGRSANPYHEAPGRFDAFLYSPVFALLMRPLAALPWAWFIGVWTVAETCAFLWLIHPVKWQWQIPLLVLCATEITIGNIYGFMGIAAVLGMRRPEAWAFPLLTKIGPGVMGLLWFAACGEWHKVARAMGATAVLSTVSFAITPRMWMDWITFLLSHSGDNGVRVPILFAVGAIATVFGARTGRVWLLPIAMLLAVPTFYGSNKDWALLVSTPRLMRQQAPTASGSPARPSKASLSGRTGRASCPELQRVDDVERP
jgi:hypothetical protein